MPANKSMGDRSYVFDSGTLSEHESYPDDRNDRDVYSDLFLLEHPFSFLPSDQGRAFAVNGSLSKGKLRGVGFIFVLCFLISSVLFLPIDVEYVIYAILLFAMMISGYLDDASKTPWNEYKKGLIDLVISVVAVLTYMNFNSTTICFGADEIVIPKALFLILGVILIWVSVNVTNCTDGVDGLCASLCSVTLLAFGVLFAPILQKYAMANFFVPFGFVCLSVL